MTNSLAPVLNAGLFFADFQVLSVLQAGAAADG